MTRILFLAAAALSACTMQSVPGLTPTNAPKAADMNAPGTCFAVVSKNADGSYGLASGVGDGTAEPKAVHSKALSATQVDAAVAKEREIMKVNPECLGTYVFDRAQADPASVAPKAGA